MFDRLVQAIADYPYLGIVLLFMVCGVGFPLPEELVLIAGGYVCATFPEKASLHWMMLWCAGSIMTFDLLPFVLGRTLGARVLRVRWLRLVVTRRRLADFDRWFRRRGDLVIFFVRFLAGIRVIAFFTAGVMKMRWRRFLMLDGLGIVIIVPLMVWLGHRGAGVIDDVIARVKQVERGLLWSSIGVLLLASAWWLLRRRARRAARPVPVETFVEPRLPVVDETAVPGDASKPGPTAAAPPTTAPAVARAAPPAPADAAAQPLATPEPPHRDA
jgi:membrane protein DedA with SNARE-associated domain